MIPYRHSTLPLVAAAALISILVILSYFLLTDTLEVIEAGGALLRLGIVIMVLNISWWLFNNWLWRWRLFRYLGLVKIPDINGTWIGEVKRDGSSQGAHSFEISVKQKFSSVTFTTRSENSSGNSIFAAFIRDETGENFHLICFWQTETKKLNDESAFEQFTGFSNVTFSDVDGKLYWQDRYFTSRRTTGGVVATREP
jgi:hypothetical protein